MGKLLSIFAVVFLFTAFKCDDNAGLTQEQEQQVLTNLRQAIENLASNSVCNENTECKYIGFGSKPCGGYRSYLIYSTSINVSELEDMVETYNSKESGYNNKYGIISDCTMVTPPTSVICENNTCVAVY